MEEMQTTKQRRSLKGIFRKKWVRVSLILFLIAALLVSGLAVFLTQRTAQSKESVTRTASVERRTIQSALSSSGTLAAVDTYSITSLVSGEVIAANFEEGDQVEKGDVLYQIDTDSIETEINSAQTNLERAQKKYQEAQEDYTKAAKDYQTLAYSSPKEGYLKTLYVKAGDTVQKGTKIADIYNDKTMVLKVPFLSSSVGSIQVGDTAKVQLSSTYETLTGTVTSIGEMETALSGGSIVKTVTIQVKNPGGLSSSDAATATVNGIACSGEGAFTPLLEETITADVSGDIAAVSVEEGAYVKTGATLFTLDKESVEEQLKNVKSSLENAEQSLEDAQDKLENQQEQLSDFEITAPISGQVIKKNVKAGDTINSSNNSTALAVIYDMSSLTFEMSVDELDVTSVKVGQKVEVTADAFEGQTFTGTVTNVSLESSASNGVTKYPVTVQLEESGDLLPGMNVTGNIVVEEAENVLTVPAEALMRGNVVYIRDDSVKEADGQVPAGFRSVEVETGLISSEYVEIKSGLSEGDEVYVQATAATDNQNMMMQGGFAMGTGDMPQGGGAMPDMGGGGGQAGGGGGPPGGGF